ncbi:MAG: hypothetical protein AAB785_02865 [Patescibacteria group bacterium]
MRHKCLAALIVFVLFFSVSGFISFWEIRYLTKPESNFLPKILDQSGFYGNLDELTASIFQNQSTQNNPQTEILTKLIASSLEPVYLKQQVEKNYQPFLSYLNRKTIKPEVVFDLRPFKNILRQNAPEKIENYTDEIIDKLPVCEEDIVPTDQKEQEMPACIPRNTTPDTYKQQIVKNLSPNELLKDVPDQYNLATDLKDPEKTFFKTKIVFLIFKIGFWGNLILTLILIGCLYLLSRPWWRSFLGWTGWTLIFPSGSIMLLNFFAGFMQKITADQLNLVQNKELILLLQPLLDKTTENTLALSYRLSGVILGLGIILVIISFFLPKPPPVPKPTPPVPAKS